MGLVPGVFWPVPVVVPAAPGAVVGVPVAVVPVVVVVPVAPGSRVPAAVAIVSSTASLSPPHPTTMSVSRSDRGRVI